MCACMSGRKNVHKYQRCVSPGHSAKYCTYTIMDDQTNMILDFQLVQVSEVANSSRMEKAGLERSLEKLENSCLQIRVLATDRHPQIAAFMRKNYQNVNHMCGIWQRMCLRN